MTRSFIRSSFLLAQMHSYTTDAFLPTGDKLRLYNLDNMFIVSAQDDIREHKDVSYQNNYLLGSS